MTNATKKLKQKIKEWCENESTNATINALNEEQLEMLVVALTALEKGEPLPTFFKVKVNVWGEEPVYLGPFLEKPKRDEIIDRTKTTLGERRLDKLSAKWEKKYNGKDNAPSAFIKVEIMEVQGTDLKEDRGDDDHHDD